MDSVIKLEDVSFFYDKGKYSEVQALKNVNMDIKQGEYVSFFGPSGCGKSTILYIISGVERPDEGKVFTNGQDIMGLSQKELAIYRQIGIGIVFQNFNLIPSISNIDNVSLPMAFLGISSEKRKKKAMEILERLGIAQLANRYPHELSGGQQQRFELSSIKIDNALVPGRTDRLQTIIFWKTNEPANSVVYYEEGISNNDNLANKTGEEKEYTADHAVIIANFKPSTIYRIKVVSEDEAGNTASSPIRAILTPRSAESIVDVIFKNFQESFGFLKRLQ